MLDAGGETNAFPPPRPVLLLHRGHQLQWQSYDLSAEGREKKIWSNLIVWVWKVILIGTQQSILWFIRVGRVSPAGPVLVGQLLLCINLMSRFKQSWRRQKQWWRQLSKTSKIGVILQMKYKVEDYSHHFVAIYLRPSRLSVKADQIFHKRASIISSQGKRIFFEIILLNSPQWICSLYSS